MSTMMPEDNYANLLSMNTFYINVQDKERHNEIDFLYSKFLAMKEIDIEVDKDIKVDQRKYSSLKLSKSVTVPSSIAFLKTCLSVSSFKPR